MGTATSARAMVLVAFLLCGPLLAQVTARAGESPVANAATEAVRARHRLPSSSPSDEKHADSGDGQSVVTEQEPQIGDGKRATDGRYLRATENRIRAAWERACPAIVRITWGKDGERNVGSGVIVTPKGHVLTRSCHNIPRHEVVTFHLADGRRVTGGVLGWCGGWDIGMLKITGEGPWPCAELGKSADSKVGDLCLALGYPSPLGHLPYDPKPLARLGRITKSAGSTWFTCSCRT